MFYLDRNDEVHGLWEVDRVSDVVHCGNESRVMKSDI
jgi:hypothetical protein